MNNKKGGIALCSFICLVAIIVIVHVQYTFGFIVAATNNNNTLQEDYSCNQKCVDTCLDRVKGRSADLVDELKCKGRKKNRQLIYI